MEHLQKAASEHFDSFDAIAGVATAGIPAASILAHEMHLPLVYVRSSGKKHGRQNRIEGKIPSGSRCLVIEDLVSTGGSSIDAAEALESTGMHIAGMAALFTYGFPQSTDAFSKKNYPLVTLGDFATLLEVAAQNAYISQSDLQSLRKWMQNPEQWSANLQT